jgi:lipopolysaccharide transport system permease protein
LDLKEELVIDAHTSAAHYWRDIWRYRDLFLMLTWRDVLVRYKQTVFGVAWAWLRPLLIMLTFTLVFGKLAKLPSDDNPYPVLVFVALLPWQFFSTAFAAAATSLVDNANLVSKVYFPRILVPASTVMVCFVDFLVSAVLLAAMMVWYGVLPDWRVLTLPYFCALVVLLAMGIGLLTAALNVKYRDFRYVVPFLTQVGLYISPVGFSSTIVPEGWRWLYQINPLVGIIDGFRWALLRGRAPLDLSEVAIATLLCCAVALIGIRHFQASEESFADVI